MTQPIGNGRIQRDTRAAPIRDLPPFFGIAITFEADDLTIAKPLSAWLGSIQGKPDDYLTVSPAPSNSGIIYIGGATIQQVPLTGPYLVQYKDLSYAYILPTVVEDTLYASKGASAGAGAPSSNTGYPSGQFSGSNTTIAPGTITAAPVGTTYPTSDFSNPAPASGDMTVSLSNTTYVGTNAILYYLIVVDNTGKIVYNSNDFTSIGTSAVGGTWTSQMPVKAGYYYLFYAFQIGSSLTTANVSAFID